MPCLQTRCQVTAVAFGLEPIGPFEPNILQCYNLSYFNISGLPFYQHIAVIDCVLPSACRNYSADVPRCAFIGKICPLHHDPRYIQVIGFLRFQYYNQVPSSICRLIDHQHQDITGFTYFDYNFLENLYGLQRKERFRELDKS